MTADNDGTRSCRFRSVGSLYQTDVDVVAVPGIGANWLKTWVEDDSQTPWVVSEVREYSPYARVLLYDHGKPSDRDDLNTLGQKLLTQLHQERQQTSPKRPILFICHSTGGLVATAALVLAGQSTSSPRSILSSCHGIAFLATPHLGSSYLSMPEYARSIRHLLQLKYEIPSRLRDLLKPRRQRLRELADGFKAVSADMKIWTFLETADSEISIADTLIHVPITSIRSGVLDLEHEKEIPLVTDHRGAAYFKGQESTMRFSFIKAVNLTLIRAVELSAEPDIPLQVEKEVVVQINGFFEDTALGVSDDTPLKLWSTKVSLHDYLAKGPAACLRERIRSNDQLQPGSGDDTSLSEFDSQTPILHASPASDVDSNSVASSDHATDSQSGSSSRSSIKKRRRFFTRPSPSIHITGASDHSDSDARPKSSGEHSLDRTEENSESENSSGGGNMILKKLRRHTTRKSESLLVPSPVKSRLDDVRREMPPKPVPRFDRPDPGTEKLLWIHVPYTNTGWVPPVLQKACMDRRKPNVLHRLVSEENWYSHHTRARHLEPHARYVRSACIHSKTDTAPTNPQSLEDPQLALYLPYLHWDTYFNLLQRRKVVDQRLEQGRSKPVPEEISESSLEAKLIWRYLGCEPPIHFRRTLDQFGYPNLRSTVSRDDDQVLWKRTRRPVNLKDELGDLAHIHDVESLPKPFMDGKVLMVDQLWLWIVDRRTVVTFFPRQEPTTSESKLYEQANLHNSIYNELNGDLAQRFETAGDLAALIALHATTVLLDRTLHHDLQILRIFEESISILTESVTKSFKRFRSRGFLAKPADHNKTPEGKRMTPAERDARDIQTANNNRQDLSALLELRDIMDELGTITKLLDQQKATITSMLRYYEGKFYGRGFLDAVQSRLDEYRAQVSEMKENAHLAQKAVETLLDLKQKQANVDEARMARWQAEVTQNQSRSVMVFTIFTVIFLPLSFFTSLFGINAREWSGEKKNLRLNTMLAIAGPSSIALIVFALLMAFSENLRSTLWKTKKITSGITQDFLIRPVRNSSFWNQLRRLFPSVMKMKVNDDSPLKSRLDMYLGYRRHRAQFWDDDIWKRHEDRNDGPLEVPEPGFEREFGEVRYSEKLPKMMEIGGYDIG